MLRVKLIGGPLDGQVREIPREWFHDGREYISFMDYPEPARFSARGTDPCKVKPLKTYDYWVHREDGYISLRYKP